MDKIKKYIWLVSLLLLAGCSNHVEKGQELISKDNLMKAVNVQTEIVDNEIEKNVGDVDISEKIEQIEQGDILLQVGDYEEEVSEQEDPMTNTVIYPADKEVEIDLNGDGKVEKVLYKVTTDKKISSQPKACLYINDVFRASGSVLEGGGKSEGVPRNEFAIVDIDTTDSFKEIAVFHKYPEIGYATSYLRFDLEGTICSVGAIESDCSSIIGDGTIIVTSTIDILPNLIGEKVYQLQNSKLEEQTLYKVNSKIVLTTDLQLSMSKSIESEKFIVSKDETVKIIGTDNKEWVVIETASGQIGWIKAGK